MVDLVFLTLGVSDSQVLFARNDSSDVHHHAILPALENSTSAIFRISLLNFCCAANRQFEQDHIFLVNSKPSN
jgi:hypothetical protein